MNDVYKRESCVGSWLLGTRYTVNDIYKRESCVSSWLRGTRHAGVSDLYKRESCVSSSGLVTGFKFREVSK